MLFNQGNFLTLLIISMIFPVYSKHGQKRKRIKLQNTDKIIIIGNMFFYVF